MIIKYYNKTHTSTLYFDPHLNDVEKAALALALQQLQADEFSFKGTCSLLHVQFDHVSSALSMTTDNFSIIDIVEKSVRALFNDRLWIKEDALKTNNKNGEINGKDIVH